MKLTSHINSLLQSFYKSVKRFPITIILSIVFAVMMIITKELQHSSGINFMESLNRVNMILAMAVPLSLCIKLYFEKKGQYKLIHIVLAFCGEALMLVLYYFFLLKDMNTISITRYVGISFALYLSFLFIPYLMNKGNFEIYVIKVFGRFFITIIYSGVLYGGLSAILLTIDKLLGVKVSSDFYYYTFLIVTCVFAISYFLAGIPTIKDSFNKSNYSRFFKVLVLYIVMPLISVYTVILYMYFVKIIVTKQWPVGLISNLVLWYSVISAGALFFISPVYEDSKWSKIFMKIFPKLILPLILLMFFSIGIRVKAYGITENRYYVIMLSLWSLGIMIYFAINKKLKNIILPISLSIIAIISVIGPLSSYSVSKLSQNKRFETILLNNNMLKNKKIIKASRISDKDKKEISEIVNYFYTKHNLKDIKYLPKDFKTENAEKVFGFQFSSYNYNNSLTYFSFRIKDIMEPVEISGYDYMLESRYSNDYSNNIRNTNVLRVEYNNNLAVLKIYQGKAELCSKNINQFSKKLINKYGFVGKPDGINRDEMCFEEENSKVKIKVQFINISGNGNFPTGDIITQEVEYYVLVKIK